MGQYFTWQSLIGGEAEAGLGAVDTLACGVIAISQPTAQDFNKVGGGWSMVCVIVC